MDSSRGLTAFIKEENELFLVDNKLLTSNVDDDYCVEFDFQKEEREAEKQNDVKCHEVKKNRRRVSHTRAFSSFLTASTVAQKVEPLRRQETLQSMIELDMGVEEKKLAPLIGEEKPQPMHTDDDYCMNLGMSSINSEVGPSRTRQYNLRTKPEQRRLMADFNKQLSSLAPSISVLLAENEDNSFPRSSSVVFPSARERLEAKIRSPPPRSSYVPPPIKKSRSLLPTETPVGRNFIVKSKRKIEEVQPNDFQFKRTADGGLKPVFTDDDEEEDPEMPLDSTPSFEEFEREHAKVFDDIIRPGEDPKLARTRYLARMRARKFREKANLERKERLAAKVLKAAEVAVMPFTGPIEEELKVTATLDNGATATIKTEEPLEMGLAQPQYTAPVWPDVKQEDGDLLGISAVDMLIDAEEEARRKRAENQRMRRAMLSEDRKERVREQNRIRQQTFRQRRKQEVELGVAPTQEIVAYNQRKAEMAEKMRIKRAVQSEEQKALEREKNTIASRRRRQMESEEQRQLRRLRDAEAQRARRSTIYQTETEAQKAERKRIQAEKRREMRRQLKGERDGATSTGDDSSREVSRGVSEGPLPVEYPQE